MAVGFKLHKATLGYLPKPKGSRPEALAKSTKIIAKTEKGKLLFQNLEQIRPDLKFKKAELYAAFKSLGGTFTGVEVKRFAEGQTGVLVALLKGYSMVKDEALTKLSVEPCRSPKLTVWVPSPLIPQCKRRLTPSLPSLRSLPRILFPRFRLTTLRTIACRPPLPAPIP